MGLARALVASSNRRTQSARRIEANRATTECLERFALVQGDMTAIKASHGMCLDTKKSSGQSTGITSL